MISGPSGSGKGTLIKHVLQGVPGLRVSVSATTRSPRGNEQEGREYFFLSRNEFQQWAEQGRFLEWAPYNGELYGSPRSAIEEDLAAGFDVILEIELEGAWQVRDQYPDALLVFIMPPSLKELESRLRVRGTESEEAIQERLEKAEQELAAFAAEMGPGGRHRFDYVIVNDDVNTAADKLATAILEARGEDEQADHR